MTSDIKIKHLSEFLKETRLKLLSRGLVPELALKRFPDLSKLTNGLPKGNIILIGARPSNGKSVMALNIAYDLAIQGKNILFLSLEMTIPRLLERLFCLECSLHNYDLKEGLFANSQKVQEKFEMFSQMIKKSNFIASDMIGKNWIEIDHFLKNLDQKPDAVFIDHIQEITGPDRKKSMDEYLNNMRIMCIRDNFALVLCSQINRLSQNEEAKTPQLHHLKGTGFLEESADIAILLHWPYHYDRSKNKNYFEINIAKNRDGEPGYIKLRFEPHFYRLQPWEDSS